MDRPRICILVLNWNGVEDTLACLNSLKERTYSNADVVVIDNGSTDNSVAEIKRSHEDVEILALEQNRLFGGGNNAGLEWAANKGYEYIIFLNNDTLVDPGFIEPLVKGFQSHPRAGMAAPLICYAAAPDLVWYGGGRVNLWAGEISHRFIRKPVDDVPWENVTTDYITGCCMMMPATLALELKGFDPWFKMYGEDVDLSLRTRNTGRDLLFIPGSRILHKVSASMGGEFNLKKLSRKAVGMFKIFKRYASPLQWVSIPISQLFIVLGKVLTLAWSTLSQHKVR